MKKHFNLGNVDNCVQCYKCVRMCPTKAIKVSEDNVEEDANLCIDCGKCFNVCNKNVHYNKVNFEELDNILKTEEVIAVLDTTLFMSIYDYKYNQIKEALLDVGFSDVCHSFDGLTVHDYIIKKAFDENDGKFYFNSNCVPFMSYIKKFKPEITENILPYANATEIACILAKEKIPNKKVLLVTNCFGDFSFVNNSDYVDYAIIGEELEDYLKEKGIKFSDYVADDSKEVIYAMTEISGISPKTVSGFDACNNISDYVMKQSPDLTESLRFFLCQGGCFSSGAIRNKTKPFEREQKYFKFLHDNFICEDCKDVELVYGDIERFKREQIATPVNIKKHSRDTINSLLASMGIDDNSGEYNCNACGYGTCDDFARAILNDRAYKTQCVPYLMRENKKQKAQMSKMIDELNEAFSLTIPDSKLEKKLKSTPMYKGVYDVNADYLEITEVIDKGLYLHIINSLKLAADLQDCKVFQLIGMKKNTLVSAILYHANAKTQPVLCVGDVVKYSALFEDKKIEASRSATFAKKFYNVDDDVFNIIKYHKHSETEIAGECFPKYLLPTYRLFKVIDSISSVMTKSQNTLNISFKFENFILYIIREDDFGKVRELPLDLYRKLDSNELNNFLKC